MSYVASGREVSRLLDGSAPSDRTFGPGEFPLFSDFAHTSDLSTDPATLERQIRDAVSPGGASPEPYTEWAGEAAAPPAPDQEGPITWGLVRMIGDMLRDPTVRPDLKAALMRVAMGIAGVGVTTDAVDPVGRPSIELSITTEDQRHEWWFDAGSEQLLAARDTPVGSSSPGRSTVVRAAGVVASTSSEDLVRSFVPANDSSIGPSTLNGPGTAGESNLRRGGF